MEDYFPADVLEFFRLFVELREEDKRAGNLIDFRFKFHTLKSLANIFSSGTLRYFREELERVSRNPKRTAALRSAFSELKRTASSFANDGFGCDSNLGEKLMNLHNFCKTRTPSNLFKQKR